MYALYCAPFELCRTVVEVNDLRYYFPALLRTQTIQKWVEICKADFIQPKVLRTWRYVNFLFIYPYTVVFLSLLYIVELINTKIFM